MDKMRMESLNLTSQNVEKIEAIFPNCITESRDENGQLKKSVNFKMLKQMLSEDIVDGEETYEFTWVGKKESIVEANKPIRKTLRPAPGESVDWKNTENLYIEGDNLEVLKLLQESYLGKVKMIYIDPPYNTGNDFIYNDDFKVSNEEYAEESGEYDEEGNRMFKNTDSNGRFHSDWCSMMYSRLLVAKNLLREDGVIFISIDDNEVENLKKICDEVFGEHNFIDNFIWNSSTGGGIRSKFVNKSHQYILFYAKEITRIPTLYAQLSEKAMNQYKSKDEKGLYRDKDFAWKNSSNNPNQKYSLEAPDGEVIRPKDGYILRFIKERYLKELKEGNVTFKRSSGGPFITDDGKQANWNVYIKKYLGDGTGAPVSLLPREHVGLNNDGTVEIQNLFNTRLFEYPKSTKLLVYILRLISDKEAIILDFFSGSATTAHAVMKLNVEDGGNRKFIMVQVPEETDEKSEAYKAGYKNICEIGKERIRRAGNKINGENPLLTSDLDIGFRVLKVDSSNMKDVYYSPNEISQDFLSSLESNIKEDRTDLDLLFGCLLEWGLPLSLPYKSIEIDGCVVHNYNDGDLIACFEENISENVMKEIAKLTPLRAVFRDSSFENSAEKINTSEIFKLLSPDTKIKVI